MRAEAGPRYHARKIGTSLVLALASSACLSAANIRPRVHYPFWSIRPAGATRVGCAELVPWISRSGKTGVGASLQVRAPVEPCPVAIMDARLEIAGRSVPASAELPARRMGQGEVARAYLPFLFDNEASWNRGEQTGELVLHVIAGGAEGELRFNLIHQMQSFLTEEKPLSTVAPSVDPLEVKMIDPPPAPAAPIAPAVSPAAPAAQGAP